MEAGQDATSEDPRALSGQRLSVEGQPMRYVQAGTGPDVILIHGALATLDDMRIALLDRLAPDYRVTAVDRPGHGGSERPRLADASPRRQAAQIREAAKALGLVRPVVLGHSFGGSVALAYGLDYPDEIAGVVAIAPICFPEARLEHVLFGPRAIPVMGDLLAGTAGQVIDAALLPALRRAMFLPQTMPPRFEAEFPFAAASRPSQMIANGEDAASLGPGLAELVLRYPECRVPVEVIAGGSDIVVNNLLHGRAAAGMLPLGSFDLLPGSGHMLHHFRQDEVLSAIRRAAARAP